MPSDRFALAASTPVFRAKCVSCGRKLVSDRDRIYGDTEGRAFVDYYCEPCANTAE